MIPASRERLAVTKFGLELYEEFTRTLEIAEWYGNEKESFEEFFIRRCEIEYKMNSQKFSLKEWRTFILLNLPNLDACLLIDKLQING